MTTRQEAEIDLIRWQGLRNAGFTPEERIEILMTEFFRAPPPCDVEFNAIMNRVSDAMMESAHV